MSHPLTLLKKEKMFAGKEMGQNFIKDPGIAERIADKASIGRADTVLEIGPGLGSLTMALAGRASKVIAVEKDRRLVPLLEAELKQNRIDNVTVIRADFLTFDLKPAAEMKKLVVVGNLPYNISSQILFRLVQEREYIARAVLMFQKEVAVRISAPPGTRDFGRLSAVVQYCATVSDLLDVEPASFFPQPDVDSRVILVEFNRPAIFDKADETFHFDVIRAAFSKRRKTLKNALTNAGLPVTKDQVAQALTLAGIDPQRRAETLQTDEFVRLSRSLGKVTGT